MKLLFRCNTLCSVEPKNDMTSHFESILIEKMTIVFYNKLQVIIRDYKRIRDIIKDKKRFLEKL